MHIIFGDQRIYDAKTFFEEMKNLAGESGSTYVKRITEIPEFYYNIVERPKPESPENIFHVERKKCFIKYFDTNLPRNQKMQIRVFTMKRAGGFCEVEEIATHNYANLILCFSHGLIMFFNTNKTSAPFLPKTNLGFVERTVYRYLSNAIRRDFETGKLIKRPKKSDYEEIYVDEIPIEKILPEFAPENFFLYERDNNLIFAEIPGSGKQKIYIDKSFSFDPTKKFSVHWRKLKFYIRKQNIFIQHWDPPLMFLPTFVIFTGCNTLYVYDLTEDVTGRRFLPLSENKKYVEENVFGEKTRS